MKRVYSPDEVVDAIRLYDAVQLGRVTINVEKSATTRARLYEGGNAEVEDVDGKR